MTNLWKMKNLLTYAVILILGAFLVVQAGCGRPPVPDTPIETEPEPKIVDLNEAIKASGLDGLRDFVDYGNSELKKALNDAKRKLNIDGSETQAEVDRIEREIKAKQEKIAQTNFVSEYTYSASEYASPKDLGNGIHGVIMRIDMGFRDQMVSNANVSFPAGLSLIIDQSMSSCDRSGRFDLGLKGSADDAQKIKKGNDKYRVKIWFNNLLTNGPNDTPSADVQRIEIVNR